MGIINSQFKLIIDTIYDKLVNWYDDGYISVTKNNKYGVIDMKGNILIPIRNEGLKRVANKDFEVVSGDKKEIIHLKKVD